MRKHKRVSSSRQNQCDVAFLLGVVPRERFLNSVANWVDVIAVVVDRVLHKSPRGFGNEMHTYIFGQQTATHSVGKTFVTVRILFEIRSPRDFRGRSARGACWKFIPPNVSCLIISGSIREVAAAKMSR